MNNRHVVAGKKDQVVFVKLTEREKEWLRMSAAQHGMTTAEYARHVLLNHKKRWWQR